MGNMNAGIGTNANFLANMANWLGRRAMFWFSRPAEERVARFAKFMDSKFELPWLRLRFGWDPILNIIPIVGSAVGLAAGLYLLFEGRNLRLGRFQQLRMVANLLVDSIGGSLPVVGWVFDWLWKANSRNAAIILREVEGRKPGVPGVIDVVAHERTR